MKKIYIPLLLLLIFSGCESFVENTSSSISYVTDEEINDPANIPFLINGVLNDYSSAHTMFLYGLIYCQMHWLMMVKCRVQRM